MRRLSRARESLLLMAVESTRVQRSGLFRLKAGRATGLPQNDYWHKDLVGLAGRHVVARFDPEDLHAGVEVFDMKGRWVCRAECRLPVGFRDVAGAKTHGRARRQYLKALDRADAARERMADVLDEHGVTLPAAAQQQRGPRKLVRMVPETEGRPDTERRKALRAKLDRGLKRMAEGQ